MKQRSHLYLCLFLVLSVLAAVFATSCAQAQLPSASRRGTVSFTLPYGPSDPAVLQGSSRMLMGGSARSVDLQEPAGEPAAQEPGASEGGAGASPAATTLYPSDKQGKSYIFEVTLIDLDTAETWFASGVSGEVAAFTSIPYGSQYLMTVDVLNKDDRQVVFRGTSDTFAVDSALVSVSVMLEQTNIIFKTFEEFMNAIYADDTTLENNSVIYLKDENLSEILWTEDSSVLSNIKLDLTGCTSLTKISGMGDTNLDWMTALVLPDSLKELGEFAFHRSYIESLVLGDMTSVGDNALRGSQQLKYLELNGNVASWGQNVFPENEMTIKIGYIDGQIPTPESFGVKSAMVIVPGDRYSMYKNSWGSFDKIDVAVSLPQLEAALKTGEFEKTILVKDDVVETLSWGKGTASETLVKLDVASINALNVVLDLSRCSRLTEVRGATDWVTSPTWLKEIRLPDNPGLKITDMAFYNCTALESFTVGEDIEGCNSLGHATLGFQVFLKCSGLLSKPFIYQGDTGLANPPYTGNLSEHFTMYCTAPYATVKNWNSSMKQLLTLYADASVVSDVWSGKRVWGDEITLPELSDRLKDAVTGETITVVDFNYNYLVWQKEDSNEKAVSCFIEVPEGVTGVTLDLSGCTVLQSISNPQTAANLKWLSSVILPQSCTTLGTAAFAGSGLTSINLDYVTTLSGYALSHLSNITIELNHDISIGYNSLYGLSGTILITYDDAAISFTSAPQDSFKNKVDLVVPVKRYQDYVSQTWSGSNQYPLKGVNILSRLTDLQASAAEASDVIALVDDTVETIVWGEGTSDEKTLYLSFKDNENLLGLDFTRCSALKEIRGPGAEAGNTAETWLSNVRTLVLPRRSDFALTNHPFKGSKIGTNLELGGSEVYNGYFGFYDAADGQLEQSFMLDSLNFEDGTFAESDGFKTKPFVYRGTTKPNWNAFPTGANVFCFASFDTVLTWGVPETLSVFAGVEYDDAAELWNGTQVKSVTLETLGTALSRANDDDTLVVLDSSVQKLVWGAGTGDGTTVYVNPPDSCKNITLDLSRCTALTSMEGKIGSNTLLLKSIIFPEKLRTFGSDQMQESDSIFEGQTRLESVLVPDSWYEEGAPAVAINKGMFNGCTALTTLRAVSSTDDAGVVNIPDSFTFHASGETENSADHVVFEGCTGITSVKLGKNMKSFIVPNLKGLTNLTTVSVAEGNDSIRVTGGNMLVSYDGTTLLRCFATGEVDSELLKNITSIDTGAFTGNTGITKLDFTGSAIRSVQSYCFEGCTALAEMDFRNSQLRTIGGYLFGDSGTSTALTVYMREDLVVEIDQYAFSGGKGATVYVPSGMKAAYTDTGCYNVSFKCEGQLELADLQTALNSASNGDTIVIEDDTVTTFVWGSGTSTATTVYVNPPRNLENITLDLSGCTALTNMSGAVSDYYIRGCLKSISFPESLRTFKTESMFSSQRNLTTVILPDAWYEEGAQAVSCARYLFNANDELKTIRAKGHPEDDGKAVVPRCITAEGLFNGCTAITDLVLPKDADADLVSCFTSCTGIENVTIHDENTKLAVIPGTTAITSYDGSVLYLCPSSTEMTSENLYNVTSISNSAFHGNRNLTSIDLSGTTITQIPDDCFYNCESLNTISFPTCLESIGSSSFSMCYAITTLDFSGTALNSVGSSAFYGTLALEMLKFPETVKALPSCMIMDYERSGNVTDCTIILPSTTEVSKETDTFNNIIKNYKVLVPSSLVSKYESWMPYGMPSGYPSGIITIDAM